MSVVLAVNNGERWWRSPAPPRSRSCPEDAQARSSPYSQGAPPRPAGAAAPWRATRRVLRRRARRSSRPSWTPFQGMPHPAAAPLHCAPLATPGQPLAWLQAEGSQTPAGCCPGSAQLAHPMLTHGLPSCRLRRPQPMGGHSSRAPCPIPARRPSATAERLRLSVPPSKGHDSPRMLLIAASAYA